MLDLAMSALDHGSKLALIFIAYEVFTIKRNHLPHIYSTLQKLNREVGVLIGRVASK